MLAIDFKPSKKLLPLSLGLVLSMSAALGSLAQEEAGATSALAPSDAEAPVGSDARPLRNVELLNRMDDDRLPTRPRRFLKQQFRLVRQAKDEKILQLLLLCVGIVGAFVAILALRSVPPGRGESQ